MTDDRKSPEERIILSSGLSAAVMEIRQNEWSEWSGSNARPPAPKAGALPTAQHPDNSMIISNPTGIFKGNLAKIRTVWYHK